MLNVQYGIAISMLLQCTAQYFPLFYSADMDDFAMTYGHFMNAQEI